ncbi:MAG: FtsX-like permease family protein [Bacteroidota bacterium]
MFKNYIKLAFKVMGRNRFYTFISLFGISFTLMILMVLTAFLDDQLGSHAPFDKADRISFLTRVVQRHMVTDTTLVVDSTLQNGVMVYDTVENTNEVSRSVSMSDPSFKLLNEYLDDMPYVEKMTKYSTRHSFDIFLNSNKLTFSGIYNDATYWEVFSFNFIEGGPYYADDVKNRLPKAVISEDARLAYFGSGEKALGREVFVNQTNFEVVGVVESLSPSKQSLHADVYMPYTFMRPSVLKENSLQGPFEGAFLLGDASELPLFDDELRRMEEVIPLPNPDEYNKLELGSYDLVERFAFGMFYEEDKEDSMRVFILIFGGLMSLFILLPTLNLINVNVTRIMERSSEIGVRKAFGANTQHLLVQFLFENVILTLIGGVLGCLMALGLIYLINDSNILTDLTLKFNPTVFFYGFLVCLFFGVLSGLLPALRMSRLHVVSALKENAA